MIASQDERATRVITCGIHVIVLPPHNERGPSYLSSLAGLHISPLLASCVIICIISHMTYYKQRYLNHYAKEEPSGPSTTMVLLALIHPTFNILLISISKRHILTIRTTIESSGTTRSITEFVRIKVSEFTGQLLVKQP
jgi:hypothetical protein